MKACVIIPTFNNCGTIAGVIDGVRKYIEDIIVVNDGSTDETESILSAFPHPITIVSYGKNRGKGYALVQGFRKAMEIGFTHAITIDADGQHFADDIPVLLEAQKDNKDGIIVGCRNLSEDNMPRQNTFANKFSNFWFRLQTGVNLPDTQSGFRLYTLSALKGLRFITSRYEAELEFLVYASWSGMKITSVPVRVYYPPVEERVSHFRPIYDFARISVLNTVLCVVALLYALRQAVYTIFSFVFFLGLATELTIIGFFLITIGGATEEHKLKYHRILQSHSRFVINHVPGTTFTYSNPHGETFEKPSVIVCNHQSHIDLMAIMMLSPYIIILTKNWVWHNPFYGLVIRYADYFPVSETEEMTNNLRAMVQKGYSIMIFPEGTRSEDCRIRRFHRGAFYLAEQLNLDIVPVCIKGFGEVLPKKSFYLHPGRMSMKVLKRIHRDNPSEMCGFREMTRKVRQLIIDN